MKLINRCYELREIRNYKKEIEEYELQKTNPQTNGEIKEVEMYKYHRVYYYDRREACKNKKVTIQNLTIRHSYYCYS